MRRLPGWHPIVLSVLALVPWLAGAPAARADGTRLYEQLCANCHGTDLVGGKGGSLLGPLKHGDDETSLARAVTDGFPGLGMPGMGRQLSDADVHALVVFMREKRANPTPLPPPKPIDSAEVRRTQRHAFRIEYVVKDGLQIPWAFAWLPDGRMLVTERAGRLRLVERGALQPEPVRGIPAVVEKGEGGMMDVAAHDGWIYLSFADPGEGDRAMTKIVRGRLRGNEFVNQETIFALPREQYPPGYELFGSRLAFGGGHLFFTIGERKVHDVAQQPESPLGKVHRVRPDGTIPPDNPFAQRPGACGSVWSYGHRNPQGLAVHPATGEIWESEHGPRGGDEVNFIKRGANYGWPLVTHGVNYDGSVIADKDAAEGLEPPARHWTPSIAVSPVEFYSGGRFPGWKDSLFVGSLARQKFLRFEVRDGRVVHEEEIFSNLGRVRAIGTGPDGLLYVALEQLNGASGWIVRLVPAE
ncbi:MAG TPA: PQQ-dependent sugar dehydrogenase [Opitutaceae bacterium]|nr:PQQ-dependent sugar dehydrogenase [Opitutaceae bacterium]